MKRLSTLLNNLNLSDTQGSSEREDEIEEQKEGGRSRKLKVGFGEPNETLTS